MWYMFPIQCEKLRVNHLTPLLVVTMPYACWFLWRVEYIEDFKWCLHFQFGVVSREVYIWRPNSRLKGIEDFNLNIVGGPVLSPLDGRPQLPQGGNGWGPDGRVGVVPVLLVHATMNSEYQI